MTTHVKPSRGDFLCCYLSKIEFVDETLAVAILIKAAKH